MSKLRIGLIGPGYIATKAIGPAIKKSRFAQLEVVASRDEARANEFARRFGCRPLKNYNQLINDPSVECVYISLPNALHFPWVIRALKAGKHVICDKPAVLSLGQAHQVVEQAKRNKVRFLEGYMFRFHPQHAKVLQLIKSGAIGEVRHYEASFGFPPLDPQNFRYSKKLGGGAINDAAGYLVSGSRMVFSSEPTSTQATVHRPKGKQVETRGAALLTFPGGRTAQITFGFDFSYRNYYTIWGSKGTITVSPAFTMPASLTPSVTLTTDKGTKHIAIANPDHFQLMIDAFAKAVLNPKRSSQNFEHEFLTQTQAMALLRRSLK